MTDESKELEWKTRKVRIDTRLISLGWNIVNDKSMVDKSKLTNHAVYVYETITGPADYAFFVNGQLLGFMEAKKVSTNPQEVLGQAKRYSRGAFDGTGNWDGYRVPLLYSSNGEKIWFLDIRNSRNIRRELKDYHTPSAMKEMFYRDIDSSIDKLTKISVKENGKLRPYQEQAIIDTEKSLINYKRNMLIAMATGTGKTFLTVSQIYRFLKSGVAKRILFLVDRKALAAQAVRTFASFDAPTGLKFDSEYEVYSQAFRREDFGEDEPFDPKVLPNEYLTNPGEEHTFVYVCTIQRMAMNLYGKDAISDESLELEGGISDSSMLDIPIHAFDMIIADEASQSDISALAIMYLGKKIIIVGDDEQVSPSAVGVDIDKMEALSSMYIKGVIPNAHLYDMKSSLYDIAKTTFPTLMLKEHFRCVPEIIGYSNRLSYDYKIKPLRDDSNSVLKPATISYRVNGERKGNSKTNEVEANNIIALMISCMEQPEYENMTFGVISLLGDEQARQINDLALEKIEPKEYTKRAILCGNASHFQGDERDVIFLSLVDSNEGEGPLRMTGEGIGKATKQRYNVAVSRAKNQIWVVHSLDVSRDLKNGDMRRDLIEYLDSPNSILEKIDAVNAFAESPFEKSVGRDLVSKGYHIVPQWEVGSYRIDMVAVCGGGKVAIECDGELYHSGDDKVREDMERQTILERLGWRFIRIRGSEYYRNPKSTIERVISELNEYGIDTENINEDIDVSANSSELFERVKIGAMRILDEWTYKEEGQEG